MANGVMMGNGRKREGGGGCYHSPFGKRCGRIPPYPQLQMYSFQVCEMMLYYVNSESKGNCKVLKLRCMFHEE
jgi:hypothetical protein